MSIDIESTTLKIAILKPKSLTLYRNGNFCKGTQVSKIIAGGKVDASAVCTDFSRNSKLVVFGCFAVGQHANEGFFCYHRCIFLLACIHH